MVEAMDLLRRQGREVVIYKNNVDGKGASYSSHENYLMRREVEFIDIIRYLTPFFVTRPVICGAGRVGLGQRNEVAGFQISQRADYVENDVGLETTFNRPIINTRDSARGRRGLAPPACDRGRRKPLRRLQPPQGRHHLTCPVAPRNRRDPA